MVLEIQTDTRQVHNRLDTHSAQLLGVTNTGTLQDQGRRQRAARHNDLLARLERTRLGLAAAGLGGDRPDARGAPVFNDHLVDFGVTRQIQVRVHRARGVDVPVGRVAAAARVAVDPFQPVLGTVASHQVLEIVDHGDPLGLDGAEEILLNRVGVVSKGDLDGALITVDVAVVRRALVRLMLFHQGEQLLGCPPFGLEVVIVGRRGARVHHEIDGGATAQDVCAGHDGTTAGQPLGWTRLVKGGRLGV